MDLRLDRASGRPLGTQLEARLREAIAAGTLGPGDRLPSLRHVAAEAGVNVNTVRAVYARMEAAGAIVTEQGRGTFVAPAATERSDAAGHPSAGEVSPGGVSPGAVRRTLRDQIARLEAELARMPAPRPAAELAQPPAYPGLLTTAELAAVRDALLDRLDALDTARAEVIRRLATLDDSTGPADAAGARQPPVPAPRRSATTPRRSSTTLSGARVRWVGA